MEKVKQQSLYTILLGMFILVIALLSAMVIAEWTKPRPGTIVLPAGGTYLGPNSKNK